MVDRWWLCSQNRRTFYESTVDDSLLVYNLYYCCSRIRHCAIACPLAGTRRHHREGCYARRSSVVAQTQERRSSDRHGPRYDAMLHTTTQRTQDYVPEQPSGSLRRVHQRVEHSRVCRLSIRRLSTSPCKYLFVSVYMYVCMYVCMCHNMRFVNEWRKKGRNIQ